MEILEQRAAFLFSWSGEYGHSEPGGGGGAEVQSGQEET
jgi:hypothetical protein